jgi:4-hydroxy-tetrahydrodipicolinate synthase
MFKGAYTALITPFTSGQEVDQPGLEKLVAFQVDQGISGVLAVGTTGESPTLTWEEHNSVTETVCSMLRGNGHSIAGTGSNSTDETLKATEHAAHAGADAALLVDPYYNGPSSLEIRKEYVEPIAKAFPNIQMIPYVIPGRSGTQLLPEDLGILNAEYPNVCTVKEATGDLDNMARTRDVCGDDFTIMSGDDDKTFDMMTDERIRSAGVISVMSNVTPGTVQKMTEALLAGDTAEADRLRNAMAPLLGMVGVASDEETPYGTTTVKARNPLPLKALMNILGMPSGPCRRPLGKMNKAGLQIVLENARKVHTTAPEVLGPIGDFFGVDIEARLADASSLDGLAY